MKFQIKAIVAAVALAAAGSAMADIQPGNLTSGATGGELVFYAFDDVTGNSYVKDLGVTFSTFLTSPWYSHLGSNNVGSDSNWTSFVTAQGTSGLGNVTWGVLGTLKQSTATTGAAAVGAVQILTTARGDATANTSSTTVRGIDGIINTTWLGALQGTNNNYAVNSSYFTVNSDLAANFGGGPGINHTYNSKVGFAADNYLSTTTADFFKVSTVAGTGFATISNAFAAAPNNVWYFDGSTVAAIPEPETYGMLAAGLLMLGAVARRRKV